MKTLCLVLVVIGILASDTLCQEIDQSYSRMAVRYAVSVHYATPLPDVVMMPSYTVDADIPQRTLRNQEVLIRELDKRFRRIKESVGDDGRKKVSLVKSSVVVPTFLEDLIILSNDVAVKYRGGHRISPNGILYVRGGIMYSPDKYHGRISYGIASVKRATGPAIRYRW